MSLAPVAERRKLVSRKFVRAWPMDAKYVADYHGGSIVSSAQVASCWSSGPVAERPGQCPVCRRAVINGDAGRTARRLGSAEKCNVAFCVSF